MEKQTFITTLGALDAQFRFDETYCEKVSEALGYEDGKMYNNGVLVETLINLLASGVDHEVDHEDADALIREYMYECDFGKAPNARIRNAEDLWNIFHVGDKVAEQKLKSSIETIGDWEVARVGKPYLEQAKLRCPDFNANEQVLLAIIIEYQDWYKSCKDADIPGDFLDFIPELSKKYFLSKTHSEENPSPYPAIYAELSNVIEKHKHLIENKAPMEDVEHLEELISHYFDAAKSTAYADYDKMWEFIKRGINADVEAMPKKSADEIAQMLKPKSKTPIADSLDDKNHLKQAIEEFEKKNPHFFIAEKSVREKLFDAFEGETVRVVCDRAFLDKINTSGLGKLKSIEKFETKTKIHFALFNKTYQEGALEEFPSVKKPQSEFNGFAKKFEGDKEVKSVEEYPLIDLSNYPFLKCKDQSYKHGDYATIFKDEIDGKKVLIEFNLHGFIASDISNAVSFMKNDVMPTASRAALNHFLRRSIVRIKITPNEQS